VQDFLEDLAFLPVELQQLPAASVFDTIQRLSRDHPLNAYDSVCLHLALEAGLPLAMLDHDLIRACRAAGAALI
jgi:hypothetical protein